MNIQKAELRQIDYDLKGGVLIIDCEAETQEGCNASMKIALPERGFENYLWEKHNINRRDTHMHIDCRRFTEDQLIEWLNETLTWRSMADEELIAGLRKTIAEFQKSKQPAF